MGGNALRSPENFYNSLRISVAAGDNTLLDDEFLLEIESGLCHIFRLAQIPPIIFIGAETRDLFALVSQTKIGIDDREDTIFGDHRKKARRNNVNAGKGQRVHIARVSHVFGLAVARLTP